MNTVGEVGVPAMPGKGSMAEGFVTGFWWHWNLGKKGVFVYEIQKAI